jgi:hypothetical protein
VRVIKAENALRRVDAVTRTFLLSSMGIGT